MFLHSELHKINSDCGGCYASWYSNLKRGYGLRDIVIFTQTNAIRFVGEDKWKQLSTQQNPIFGMNWKSDYQVQFKKYQHFNSAMNS